MRACTGLRLEWFGLVGWKVVEGAKAHSQTGSKSDPIPYVRSRPFQSGRAQLGGQGKGTKLGSLENTRNSNRVTF
jgi:hypothetical protein